MTEKPASPPSAAEKPLARLCYVDDSRTAAFVMRRMLEPGGYRVDYFQSAEPAIVALIQDDYDLLLTDLKVSSSGMDGDDLIRTLRQSGQSRLSQLPIIVITGSTDAEVLVKAYDAGANQVMTKPVDAEALHSHIRRLLRDGHESAAAGPQSTRHEPEDVPLVTPIQPTPPPSTGKKDEKTIPLLQVASAPAEGPTAASVDVRPSTPAAAPAAEASSTTPPASEPLSMIERAVANHAQASPLPPSGAAPESDTPLQDTAEATTQSRQDEPRRAAPDPAEPTRGVEQSKEYRGEVEIIIDAEEFPGRQRRGRQAIHGEREGDPHAAEPFVFDGMPPRSPGRLRRWFTGATLLVLLVLAVLGFAALKGEWFSFDKGLAVQTAFPEIGEIYQSIVVPGQVVSRQQVAIHAAYAGRLVTVQARPGDRVQAGQLLVRLDEHELLAQLEQAQAELASAREDISRAEQTWDSLRRAHEKGAVAERFVKDAEVKLRLARARASVVMRETRDTT
ncbi:MAG TPA: response regulator, partial [Sedimenticola sp.]|nr:response regulator [Sedimenticola sp.]